ncbi:DUF2238 domain-containing protein [Nanoarchaeota archaeon]
MKEVFKKENYPKLLLYIFLIYWIIMGISPHYRGAWISENLLTVFFVGLLILTYKKFRFSNLSYTLFFIFLVLHVIGSYYSYTEMPLFNLIKDWMNLSRNHYDRVIHFLFGVMFFVPVYEFLSKKFKIKDFWGYLLTFLVITAAKGSYEIIEYLTIFVVNQELLVTNFLGMQGDKWDSQKDLILGMLGSGFVWLTIWIKTRFKKRN